MKNLKFFAVAILAAFSMNLAAQNAAGTCCAKTASCNKTEKCAKVTPCDKDRKSVV